MRPWLVGAIVLASAIAGTLTELTLLRVYTPPDAPSAVYRAAWLTLPYLAAAGLAVVLRRHPAALAALLVALLAAAVVGVFLFDAATTQLLAARQQAATAVLPGGDPTHGPAAMRKAGIDAWVTAGGLSMLLLAIYLPPVQLAAVALTAGVGYIYSPTRGRRRPG